MPFFRRTDPRREELDRLRQRIAEMRNEVALLETAAREEDAEQASQPTDTAGPDIYTSVSRLRVTMVRRELITKQRDLQELLDREAALAHALKQRSLKDEEAPSTVSLPPVAAAPMASVGPTAAPTAPPSTNGAASVPPPPANVPAPSQASSPRVSPPPAPPPAPTTAPRAAQTSTAAAPATDGREVARPASVARTKQPSVVREGRGSPLNVVLAVIGILIAIALAVMLSGLLEIDPNRDYGALSVIARALQALTGGPLRVGLGH